MVYYSFMHSWRYGPCSDDFVTGKHKFPYKQGTSFSQSRSHIVYMLVHPFVCVSMYILQ